MKKLSLLLTLLLFSFFAYSQKGISYQAVILDPSKIEIPGQDISGQPFVNGNVNVKFVILSGTTSQFEEVQQTKTDAYGLVNLTIGSVASTAFNSINWDANQKSMQVFVSFNNGASYTKVSDQKLTYTPYALFAETAGKLGNTLGIAGGGTGATTAVGARANLGIGNVDNTADADKPVSMATQAALNLKANAADVNAALALKANTTDLDSKASLASPTFTGTISGITKSMVGLGSVDNTSDSEKPISSAAQAALNLKSNTADVNAALALKANASDLDSKASLVSPAFTGTVSGVTKLMVGLGSVDNTSDAAKPVSNATQSALDLKLNTNGNAASATKLATARSINGVAFDGTSDIYITTTADASTLSGTVATANGGTGLTTIGTAGQILTSTGSGTLTWTTSSGVPYSGATSAVNLGAYDLTVNGVNAGMGRGSISTNTVFGNEALSNNTTGTGNTAYGALSLSINTTGIDNTANGLWALRNNTTGSDNTANGSASLNYNTIGFNNTANGSSSLRNNTTGSQNTANGVWSLGYNTTGTDNTANGGLSLYLNTSGSENTASGSRALRNNTTGSQNTADGFFALRDNISGDANTASGYSALRYNITGGSNTAIGSNSLNSNTTGSNNTAIGNSADVASDNLSNATALGYGAIVSADNTIQLGNTSVTNVKTSGALTVGTVTYPNTHGTIGQVLATTGSGTLTWTSISASNAADASTLSGTVSIAKGGTGATTAAAARTNLGLVIGTNVQAPLTAGTDYLTPTGSAAGLTSFPTLNQNTTGNAATATLAGNITATSNSSLTELTNLTSVGTLITGTISLTTDIKTSGKLYAGDVSYPQTHGTAGQVLSTTGSGTLTWTSPSGVPYTGATGPVDLGGYDLVVNGITIGAGGGNILGNTSLGSVALYSNSTGVRNTAVGESSLNHNLDGNANTSVGVASLYNNSSGSYNVAVGDGALYNNFSGYGNTALGISSMYGISTGNENTAVGFNSVTNPWLVSVTGSHNTGVGTNSLNNVGSGSYNTAIGFSADIANEAFFNSTAIGNGALANASNTVQLGNTSVTKVQTSGALTTGSVTYPTTHGTTGQVLSTTGSGTLTWTSISASNVADASTLSGTVSVANGGTGATTAAAARTNLGLVIGTNVQSPLTAGTDYLTPNGNAATATKLATARNINGVPFDGSANITVAADASTLSGTISVAKGGTGTSTLSGLVVGNGSNAMSGFTGSVSGETLTWNSISSNWQLTGNSNLAIGNGAGLFGQGINSVAIGNSAGNLNQGNTSVSIGPNAASTNQGDYSIAIGSEAAFNYQGANSIALGNSAGAISQGIGSIAIGGGAAVERQGNGAIAIGETAGFYNQGANAIAIGKQAGHTVQTANSIVINASGAALTNNSIQGLFIKPVRSNNIPGGSLLQYNTSTSEIYSSNKMTNATITDKVIVGSLSETAASAVLEANSTTKGFLPPRMNNTERNAISSPDEGLMIWNTTESELNVYNGSLWINMAGISNQTLAVGMKYQGGKIAYILQSGDPGYDSQIQHGIIAAISDQSAGIKWGAYIDVNTTVDLIGSGLNNTNDIITANGKTSNYAARIARSYKGGGYNDWFLPNLEELKKLYANRTLIGGFSGEKYWSSLEDWMNTGFLAYFQDFSYSSINVGSVYKNQTYRVRSIRYF